MTDKNPTTRKYPRTLGEAFPRSPHWIDERPRPRPMDDEDFTVTVWGLVILGLTLVLSWVLH